MELTKELVEKLILFFEDPKSQTFSGTCGCPGDALDTNGIASNTCHTCWSFVRAANSTFAKANCPCVIFGPKEAVKRAWITIDEYLNP